MHRVLSVVLFILIAPLAVLAQKKEYNSLLWRISGHGLSAPSYLYGTMHLTDKRLFNFPDSLYHSLEQTAGFAAEVDMAELMPDLMENLNDEEDKKLLVKNLVRPALIAPYREKLAKKLNKKFETITWGEVKALESKMTTSLIRKGEMATFMDAYLFDIARRQGKWVGGIEDYTDQAKPDKEDEVMSAIDEILTDKKSVDNKIEWMIGIYLNQQLDTIDLGNELWQGTERNMLNRRNTKMARRIDSIMQLRTCLFAIGAAHIPGDSGVVRLLRERGFTVEPVNFSKRVEPGKYVYTSKEIPWVAAEIKNSWYSIQMPGKAEEFRTDQDNPDFSSKMFFDLTRMNAYFSFGFPVSNERKLNADSVYTNMAKNFAKNGKITSTKMIELNGIAGKEYIIKSDENDVRLQVFLPHYGVVMNMISSLKYDSLFGTDARHFFESFHVLKEPAPAAQSDWQTYSFPQHAFSIRFPVAYEKQKKTAPVDSVWNTNYYVATSGEGLSCWMIVMEAKPGYYSDSDSAYFSLLAKRLQDGFSTKGNATQSSKRTVFNDYPAFEINQKVKSKTEAWQLKGRLINRGNRRYYFYAVFSEDNSKKLESRADDYLNSFEFLPVSQTNWSYQQSPTGDISVWSPSVLEHQPIADSTFSIPNYLIYDSVSPATILIKKQYLSPYSWWENDSAFFSQQAHLYSTQRDSIKNLVINRKGEIGEADFYVNVKDNHLVEKVHLLLNGDTLYTIFGFIPPAALNDDNYNRLFKKIEVSQVKKAGFHLEHKTDRILEDLANGDSTVFAAAFESLSAASFTSADLPKLHRALLQPYRDFDTNEQGVHSELIEKVIALDSGSTFSFIKNNYASLTGDREKLKYPMLYCLLKLKTKEAFDLFREIVTSGLPKAGDAQSIRFPLSDSLALTAAIFPGILPATQDTAFIKVFPPVTNLLLDSGLISTSMLEPYKENFYNFTRREITRLKQQSPDYDYMAFRLIPLLTHFNEPAAHALLQQFLVMPGISIKENAAIALLKCGQKADPVQLEKIAKSDYYRNILYEELESLKKQKLFPAKYLTQKLFAQSDIYQVASDDYSPDAITFIGEKTAVYMGKQKRFYLFKVTFNNEDGEAETYLGITGPYSIQPGKLVTTSDIGGLSNERYDAARINAQFKKYLKEMEDYQKDE